MNDKQIQSWIDHNLEKTTLIFNANENGAAWLMYPGSFEIFI